MEEKPIAVNIEQATEFARSGIVSKTLVETDRVKLILFCMEAGQELSEHTASVPAIIHLVSGKATLKLGAETHQAEAGGLYYMPEGLVHAIKAHENLVMLLTMLR
jgi:quercetin dioxygenase-like cupin family protein